MITKKENLRVGESNAMYVLVMFWTGIANRTYGMSCNYMQTFYIEKCVKSIEEAELQLKIFWDAYDIARFQILDVVQRGPNLCDGFVNVMLRGGKIMISNCNIIRENGEWGVNPTSAKRLYSYMEGRKRCINSRANQQLTKLS